MLLVITFHFFVLIIISLIIRPIDDNDFHNCALPMTSGNYQCINNPGFGISEYQYRWCGSNYDAVGNPRFSSATSGLEIYIPQFFYGNVIFDNVGYAFIYVVQVISGDSWSTIMFQLFNSFGVVGAAIFCCIIIIYGTFFLLQLNVAVLQRIFTDKAEEDKRQLKISEKRRNSILKSRLSQTLFNNDNSKNIENSISELVDNSYQSNDISTTYDKVITDEVVPPQIKKIQSSDIKDIQTDETLMNISYLNENKDELPIINNSDIMHIDNEYKNIEVDNASMSNQSMNTIHLINRLDENFKHSIKITDKKKSVQALLKMASSKRMIKTESGLSNELKFSVENLRHLIKKSDREKSTKSLLKIASSKRIIKTDSNLSNELNLSVESLRHSIKKSDKDESVKTLLKIEKSNKISKVNSDLQYDSNLSDEIPEINPFDSSKKGNSSSSLSNHSISLNKEMDYIQQLFAWIKNWDRPQDNYFRDICHQISESVIFQSIFTILIFLNTLLLAIDHYPEDLAFYNVCQVISFFLTLCFAVEMVIMLLGLGIINYFSSSFNCIDFVIVIISIIDISVNPVPVLLDPASTNNMSGSATALRALRLLRILKLFRSDTFKRTLSKVVEVVYSMRDFLVILLIFLFIFALAGMQIFANKLRFDQNGFPIFTFNSDEWVYAPDRPRSNFDNFTIAFLTVFQIVTIDNWSIVMFNCARSLGPWAMIFAIFCFFMGTFFLTNLFLALLVDSFVTNRNEEEEDSINDRKGISRQETIISIKKFDSEEDLLDQTGQTIVSSSRLNKFQANVEKITRSFVFQVIISFFVCLSSVSLAFDNPLLDPQSVNVKVLFTIDCIVSAVFAFEMVIKILELGLYSRHKGTGYLQNGWNILDLIVTVVSILCVAQTNGYQIKGLRSIRALKAIRSLRLIQQFSGLRLVFMSIILSLPAISQISVIVFLIYFIFAVFFTTFLKGQLRGCQNGLFQSNSSYSSQETYPMAWGQLSLEQQSWFGPQGLVTPSMLSTNCSSTWPNQPCCSNLDTISVPTSRDICECWGGQWLPLTDFQYDNVAMSLLTLFDVGTIDNWSDNMHFAADTTGIDMEPIRDYNLVWYYVFFIFIIIGNFLCIQLFIGAITKSFNDNKALVINGGSAFLTKEQHEWINTLRIISQISPNKKLIRPENRFRSICFDISTNVLFDPFVMFCVICQCILLSLNYFGQSDNYSQALNTANTVLTIIFACEITVKICGFGLRNYFFGVGKIWNWIDFFITGG